MAAEDDAAGAADAQPAKQDWGADEDDTELPPLSNMGWADDDEDELPPLDPAWANLPVPDSPKREKPPAAFKPRDDRGGAEPRGSVFSRLGEGGGNAWRRPDAPPDRGGPPDRGPPRSRDPPAGRREDPPRGRREPENPHDWHREQMRLQEAERAARGERPKVDRSTAANAMPAEVVYLSRDAQRAAALKREEDAAWRLVRDPLATLQATADIGPPAAPFAPSACREMLNTLSEPPFAEGRLAPNARAAFVVVASASKAGAPRPEEDVRAVVGGVLAPLRHLLAHGVATPGGAAAGSTGAFIAEQMHTAAVKLLAAALEVLAAGEVTRNVVESAEGIARVREAVAAKLSGKPTETRASGAAGGGGAAVPGRGDKGVARGAPGGRGGRGDGPRPEPPKGPERWEKKPRAPPSEETPRLRRSGEYSDRRRSLEEKPRPRTDDHGDASSGAPAVRPRVVPKVVIRPSKEDHRRDAKPAPAPAPAKGPSAKASKRDKRLGGPDDAQKHGSGAGAGSPAHSGGVFSRLEGTPSPLPAPAGGAMPKPLLGKPTAKRAAATPTPRSAVPAPKPAAEPPRPKPAVSAPAAKPGKGGKGAGASEDATKGEKKHGATPGDEWHALDEELEKAGGKAGKGRGKDRASGGKDARSGGKTGGAEKHEIPHPKTATPTAPAIPAPKPSPGTSPAPKPAAPKDELDAVLDEELAKAKRSRRPSGRGRGGK